MRSQKYAAKNHKNSQNQLQKILPGRAAMVKKFYSKVTHITMDMSKNEKNYS